MAAHFATKTCHCGYVKECYAMNYIDMQEVMHVGESQIERQICRYAQIKRQIYLNTER